jgi:hypothetical protein
MGISADPRPIDGAARGLPAFDGCCMSQQDDATRANCTERAMGSTFRIIKSNIVAGRNDWREGNFAGPRDRRGIPSRFGERGSVPV